MIVSRDQRSVHLQWQQLEEHGVSGVFEYYPYVLGSEGFSEGRQYWEVQGSLGGCWAVGIWQEDDMRPICTQPEWNALALVYDEGHYKAGTKEETPLHLQGSPQHLGIYLNTEGREVSFFDAQSRAQIFHFLLTSMMHKPKFPSFAVLSKGAELTLCVLKTRTL